MGQKAGSGLDKRCVIISGGPEFGHYEAKTGDFVIAADRGYEHALRAGLKPDLLVGDFDSFKGRLNPAIQIIRAPAMKDDTDTMLAVKEGLTRGYKDFLLLGALGGRLDHQLANLAACAYIAQEGGMCLLQGRSDCLYAFKNRRISLPQVEGVYVSVLAYTDLAKGVTLEGLRYSLKNADLTNRFPLGVSNEFAADRAYVEVKEGILFVILSSEKV